MFQHALDVIQGFLIIVIIQIANYLNLCRIWFAIDLCDCYIRVSSIKLAALLELVINKWPLY